MKKELYENDKIEKLDSRFHGNDKIDVFSAISIHYLEIYFFFDINIHRYWRHSQVVRRRSAKPLFTGSNPVAASIFYKSGTPIFFVLFLADVAELADACDSKSHSSNGVRVQVPPRPPRRTNKDSNSGFRFI